MNSHKSRWHTWQRGQALVEYWPTLPIAIAIMLSASLITSFITDSFQKTIGGIEGTGLACAAEAETDAETEGPSYANLGGHSVQMTGLQYDPETDVTRVSYQITSVNKPAISHWILGLPAELQGLIEVEGEDSIEWGLDPTTGISGLKFDTGFEPEEAALSPDLSGYVLVGLHLREDTEVRNVYLMLAGHYELTIVNVGIKAGTETHTGEIVAPVAQVTEEEVVDPTCPPAPGD